MRGAVPGATRSAVCLLAVTACASSPPCQLVRFDDAPGAAPGEVRHAVAFGQYADVTAAPDGVACLSCSTVFYFDAALREQRQLGVDVVDGSAIAVSGDATYVFNRDLGVSPDSNYDAYSRPADVTLSAMDASGHQRWHEDFGDGEAWTSPATDVFDYVVVPEIFATSKTVVIYGEPLASVFRPSNGELQWRAVVGADAAVAPDASDGLLVATGGSSSSVAAVQATLRHLRTGGAVDWTATWTAAGDPAMPAEFVAFHAGAPTPDGGFAVAGSFHATTLDLGNQIALSLREPGPFALPAAFVAVIDGHGVTQWAAVLGDASLDDGFGGGLHPARIAATGDGVVICGSYSGPNQLGLPANQIQNTDAFVARIDRSGAITAYPITGVANQTCRSLQLAADGSATVAVYSANRESSAITVAGRTFDSGSQFSYYILNLGL